MNRGEIRWHTLRRPDKRRPFLLLTRNEVIEHLNEIIFVPATRTIRGLTSEVVLTLDDGMPVTCALNFDSRGLAIRSQRFVAQSQSDLGISARHRVIEEGGDRHILREDIALYTTHSVD